MEGQLRNAIAKFGFLGLVGVFTCEGLHECDEQASYLIVKMNETVNRVNEGLKIEKEKNVGMVS